MIDPFTVLAVNRTASKPEILRQVALVLRARSGYNARTVAEAQKMLFSPLDRAEAEFIHCWDLGVGLGTPPEAPSPEVTPDALLLEPLDDKRTSTS